MADESLMNPTKQQMVVVSSDSEARALRVADAFVKFYYPVLTWKPELAHKFYDESSQLSRPNSKGRPHSKVLKHFTSLKAIEEKLLFDHKVRHTNIHDIHSVAAKGYPDGGVIVFVKGSFVVDDDDDDGRNGTFFFQTFFLSKSEETPTLVRYFVLNDVLWFSSDIRDFDEAKTEQNMLIMEPDAADIPTLRRRVPKAYWAYLMLLIDLRKLLGKATNLSPDIPVTMRDHNIYVHLCLLQDTRELTWKIKGENAYQLALKKTKTGDWIEFSPVFPQIRKIPRSILLDFTNSYPSIASVSGVIVDDLEFNILSLSDSFNQLAGPINTSSFAEGTAKNIVSYSEGSRLRPVTKLFRKGHPQKLGSKNAALCRLWGRIGRFVMFVKKFPRSFDRVFTGKRIREIKATVKRDLALLKSLTFDENQICPIEVNRFAKSFARDAKKEKSDLSKLPEYHP